MSKKTFELQTEFFTFNGICKDDRYMVQVTMRGPLVLDNVPDENYGFLTMIVSLKEDLSGALDEILRRENEPRD